MGHPGACDPAILVQSGISLALEKKLVNQYPAECIITECAILA
jgi:hypothetical protein